jgi:hypothetical protein
LRMGKREKQASNRRYMCVRLFIRRPLTGYRVTSEDIGPRL